MRHESRVLEDGVWWGGVIALMNKRRCQPFHCRSHLAPSLVTKTLALLSRAEYSFRGDKGPTNRIHLADQMRWMGDKWWAGAGAVML